MDDRKKAELLIEAIRLDLEFRRYVEENILNTPPIPEGVKWGSVILAPIDTTESVLNSP